MRQRPDHYTIRAGRNLPDKEFRYLRTVIVTAPLHLGDLIGWDVVLNIMDVLFNETHDSKYRANVLIRKMVRAGKLGIKSGEGFFNYNK